MAKQRKLLTREQILSIPDAPKGQRACDDTEGEKKAAEQFLRCLAIKYEAAEKLTGEKKADFWTRALAVLKATGFPVKDFNRLNFKESILVLRAAAKLKTHEKAELLAAMQELLDKAETPAGTAGKTNTPPAAVEKAYQSYCWAERESGLTTDKEIYNYLKENPFEGYDLPAFDTWKTYVSRARKFYDAKKNTPRGGRSVRTAKAKDDPELLKQVSNQYGEN